MTMTSHSAPRNLLCLLGLSAALSFGSALMVAQQTAQPADDGPDPALANMAPADAAAMQQSTAQPDDSLGPPQQQAPAPIVRSVPSAQPNPGQPDDSYNAPLPSDNGDNPQADPQSDAQVTAGQEALDDADMSSDQPPPALPDYDQPASPGDNYMWTPGYWGYGAPGYYWVPGVWIVPPYYGGLWTPGYWGWYGLRYRWHPGYWGPHVGFYGGVNYGFGYIGTGYFGGYWRGNAFLYNRAVTNVGPGVSVTNVYERNVVYNHTTYGAHPTNRISYNGGHGGLTVAPRPGELVAMHENHTAPLPGQLRLHTSAAQNPQAAFSANHGRPAVSAMDRPLGGTRPIANTSAEFHQRQNAGGQVPSPGGQPQNRPPPYRQPSQQPRPQQRSAPPPRPAAPARSAPAPHESGKH